MRVEKDLLGARQVPEDVYYGIQTLRALENFPITGQRVHPYLIRAFAFIKRAAAEANKEMGYLEEYKAWAITTACEEILAGELADQFVVDPIQGGAGTSVNMNVNEVIANRALELLGYKKGEYRRLSPNSDVNMGQSTNDTFPTAIRISCLMLLNELLGSLEHLAKVLGEKSREFRRVVKVGRTHLQDAVPVTLGQEFSAYRNLIRRDIARLKKQIPALCEINMGATAVGTGLNTDVCYIGLVVDRLRGLTGFDLVKAPNLVDLTQNTDALTALSGALKILATNLSKIANDLRLMASGPRAGLAEIALPPVQPGSSIMPGKVNPVIPEVINQIAFQVIGNDATITLASGAGQLELNVMEPVMAHNLLESLQILANGVRVFADRCIAGITANRKRCRRMAEESIGLVTAINPLVGYEKATQVAKEALETGRGVKELILEKGLLDEATLDQLLAPENLTKPNKDCMIPPRALSENTRIAEKKQSDEET